MYIHCYHVNVLFLLILYWWGVLLQQDFLYNLRLRKCYFNFFQNNVTTRPLKLTISMWTASCLAAQSLQLIKTIPPSPTPQMVKWAIVRLNSLLELFAPFTTVTEGHSEGNLPELYLHPVTLKTIHYNTHQP